MTSFPFRLRALLAPSALLAGLALASSAQAAPTSYPLTVENCGVSVTFDKAPRRIVSIGQAETEILYALGLSDRVVGTAVWFGPVGKPYEAVNAGIRRLADNDPSFESVAAQEPDLVAAQFEWHVGPNGIVGKREQFAALKIATYVSPADCVAKDNSGGGDGVRKEMFTMDLVDRNIRDLAAIFDVKDRGEALIADLKRREAAAIASVSTRKARDVPIVVWFSSKDVKGEAFVAGKNGVPAYWLAKLDARNVITTDEEWPLVSWERIAATNPAVIVVTKMDRRRFPADDLNVKLNFLRTDPVVSQLEAVKKNRIVILDVEATHAGIGAIDGIEAIAGGIRSFEMTE